MGEREEEVQHGSTVLPGAPMPWFARPHDAVPDPEPEPEPLPALEPEPQVEDVDIEPDRTPATVVEPEAAADASLSADDQEPAVEAEPDAVVEAVPAATAPVHGRHRAPEPEPSGPRRLLVLLAVLVAVLVLAAVALFVWPGLLTSSDDAGAAPSPRAATSTPPVATVTLVVPATLAGLTKLTGAADKALTSALAGSSVSGLTAPVSAVYGTKGVASAQVIAWKTTAPPAADSVDAAFTGFEGSGATVTAVRPLAVGDLGGRISCGETTVSKTPSLLCFWADDVSFGSVTLLSPKDRVQAETTALAIRAGVEQKS